MGSNLGDRVASLASALKALEALPYTSIERVSSVYESEPWGVAGQPAFANAVVALDTSLSARALLEHFKQIERTAGRVAGPRNGPRPLDLDLLLYGSETVCDPDLIVPHPRMLSRDFVITPLLEIAPHVRLPGRGRVTRDAASDGLVTGVLAQAPWARGANGVPRER
jgi:2-amino-4-hydroxy-6-hydroxymethyldihydropteridine diphosphokinase